RALKAAWFHKWVVNLRMRPEEYGALAQANLTHQRPMPQAAAALHCDVLKSAVLPIIYAAYGSYLLPQAFPEGSPTHPCYPTGHGTVGGACITALKFFFDGSQRIRPLLQAAGSDVYVPSADGLSLEPYTGADRDHLTINGELAKLGWNITLGHGIHAGIHFRSSSYYSLLLGEQVALSVLQDRAEGYNEPFTIKIKKFDYTTATISNRDCSGRRGCD
ncbi:MAG TPA: phosphoesterase, partial [Bacillota bacterium]|nr:phosphoesterase [Bacillota bacterium]